MNDDLLSLHKLVWTSLLAATIAAGAFMVISIGPVPISMQPFFIFLAGYILGPVRGGVCVLLYIGAGVIGLPVFSGGKSGLAHLMGPTGGYLIGFVFSAVLTGMTTRGKKSPGWVGGIIWGLLALIVAYAAGVAWLKHVIDADWHKALMLGCYPFIGWDIIKVIGAIACCRLLNRYKLLSWQEE